MRLNKTQPMKKKPNTAINVLQSRYLNDAISVAKRAMLKKAGVPEYHRGYRDAPEPARITKMRAAVRAWEKKTDEEYERKHRKACAAIEERVQRLRGDILFMEPKEALAAVRAFAAEAGVKV